MRVAVRVLCDAIVVCLLLGALVVADEDSDFEDDMANEDFDDISTTHSHDHDDETIETVKPLERVCEIVTANLLLRANINTAALRVLGTVVSIASGKFSYCCPEISSWENNRYYSGYCAAAFCCVLKCEPSYKSTSWV